MKQHNNANETGPKIDGKPNAAIDNADTAMHDAQEERSAHVASNISSSMSGNVIGDMVGNKRMNLLDAMHDAEPQLGRRPEPVNDPWPRRKMFIRGIVLGLAVCIVVVALIIVLSQTDGSTGTLF